MDGQWRAGKGPLLVGADDGLSGRDEPGQEERSHLTHVADGMGCVWDLSEERRESYGATIYVDICAGEQMQLRRKNLGCIAGRVGVLYAVCCLFSSENWWRKSDA